MCYKCFTLCIHTHIYISHPLMPKFNILQKLAISHVGKMIICNHQTFLEINDRLKSEI